MATAVRSTGADPWDSTTASIPANLPANPQISTLRRTTCDVCRERKVRCDRTKPECLRCRRSGAVCAYPSPDADAAKIQQTLQSLSKRLEDAESRLQSSQPPAHGATPITASGGQMMDFSIVDFPGLGFSAEGGDDANFQAWDQPMIDDFGGHFGGSGKLSSTVSVSPLPYGTLSDSVPTPIETGTTTATTANSSRACTIPQELGHGQVDQPSPPENGFGTLPVSPETCARLFEAYFDVVQKHLPLMSKSAFYRTLQQSPDKHQTLALKYAVCMAGAQAERDSFQFKEQCYIAARLHLEQAELGSGASSFWNAEAAQALVLVARFEFEHFTSPRAMVTTSRLFALMSVLCHQDISGSEKEQGEDEEEPNLLRMVMLVSLSMKFRETGVLGNSKFKPPSVSNIYDDIDLDRLKINLLTTSRSVPENDAFGVLCVALKIASDAEQHDRMTTTAVSGVDLPAFNFCRTHERLETKIGTIVTQWLTSSPSSALSSGPHCELRVLALLVALGTRIQLFNTAVYHGGRSKFLHTITYECREESVSSAIDISDLLCYAEVLRPDKITIYREASFYMMPPLRLAAEALVAVLQARGQDSARRIPHGHLEVRQSLKTILQVMDACKNEAGSYNDCIGMVRAYLGSLEETSTPLRTGFSASSSLGKK
ncbi:hypothetical protein INS49_004885 [Diaporthe citri]|uniref:uncharacterized protein n=1 Tax=Diaporthe citri TaxID=83186 RepID=UPI001C8147CD|nr:uncharacterized protein INS49_004885 [Diaporthe citri]KAG6354280.1 hypothetical protein INS49_004885 [Diaporthe citri]